MASFSRHFKGLLRIPSQNAYLQTHIHEILGKLKGFIPWELLLLLLLLYPVNLYLFTEKTENIVQGRLENIQEGDSICANCLLKLSHMQFNRLLTHPTALNSSQKLFFLKRWNTYFDNLIYSLTRFGAERIPSIVHTRPNITASISALCSRYLNELNQNFVNQRRRSYYSVAFSTHTQMRKKKTDSQTNRQFNKQHSNQNE